LPLDVGEDLSYCNYVDTTYRFRFFCVEEKRKRREKKRKQRVEKVDRFDCDGE